MSQKTTTTVPIQNTAQSNVANLGLAANIVKQTEFSNGASTKIVPKSGDYVLFPLRISEHMESKLVTWFEQGDAYSATYYRLHARWFFAPEKAEKDGEPKKEGQPAGEVTLWIAQEFIDPEYRGVWENEHTMNNRQWENDVDTPAKLTLGLKETLFYGQTTDGSRRFLVYHPANRKPSQGRFEEGALSLGAKVIQKLLPSVGDVQLSPDTIPLLVDFLQRGLGDQLRSFPQSESTTVNVVAGVQNNLKDANLNNVNGVGGLVTGAVNGGKK